MYLSKGTNFAFHALVKMGLDYQGEPVGINVIARSLGAPPNYMAKLFQRLGHARLVMSKRGASGGYSLARPANQINLWDVVVALEGDHPIEKPMLPLCKNCFLKVSCPLEELLVSMKEKIVEAFQDFSLEKMMISWRESSEIENSLIEEKGIGTR